MERLGETKPRALTSAALRTWGMLFLAAGVISRGILQNRALGMGGRNNQQLLEVLSTDPSSMTVAAAALILQAVETCAVPIFALLLTEGFSHTKDWTKYLLRVAIAALVSEIPYDLAMTGRVLDLSSQNPGFAMILGLVVLYLFRRFSEKNGTHRLLKLFVVIAAIVWAEMLRIQHGSALMIMTGVFWLVRGKPQFRGLVGAGAAMGCCIISPFYVVASMGALPIHLYNGNPGTNSRVTNYALYPVLLMAIWAAATFAF